MKQPIIVAAFALSLAACSSEPAPEPTGDASQTPLATQKQVAATTTPTQTPTQEHAGSDTLTLDGLGALRIGQPLPATWKVDGVQASDECLTAGSPDYPGVYAIVEGGKVRRVSVGEGSPVKLVEGVGVGSSEAEVRKAFAGFREEPHTYVEPPAKYLTAPNARSGDPALRFEIGADRKVEVMHVGTAPTLEYVEGCA